MKRTLLQRVIKRYPLLLPRLYVLTRSLILPLEEIDQYIPPNKKVIDVGCGYGFTTLYFALKSTKRQVTGIEIDSKRISIAKQSSLGIPNVNFSVENLISKQSEKYDVIVAIDLLHHLSRPQKFKLLKQCHKLLSSHGILIIKDINTAPLYKFCWNYIHDLIMTMGSTLEFLGEKDMEALLESNGFSVKHNLSLKNMLYPHHLYVCQKS